METQRVWIEITQDFREEKTLETQRSGNLGNPVGLGTQSSSQFWIEITQVFRVEKKMTCVFPYERWGCEMCNERCKNGMEWADLCESCLSEYDSYMLKKYEEELMLMAMEQEHMERMEMERMEQEDAAEHAAMYLLEKGF